MYCPWNAADLVDKAIEDSPWRRHLQGTAVKVVATTVVAGVLVAGFVGLGPMEPLVWLLTVSASIGTVAAWVLGRRARLSADPAVE